MNNERCIVLQIESFFVLRTDDYYVSTELLTQLSQDVSELNASGDIYHFDATKKAILIDVVMRFVDAAKNLSIGSVSVSKNQFKTSHFHLEKTFTQNSKIGSVKKSMDKILAAAEASLLVCNLYSSSKKSELEKLAPNEHMKKIVKFVQLQMRETIFPKHDRSYALENSSGKNELRKWFTEGRNTIRKIGILYEKSVRIIGTFVRLFERYSFNDSIVFEIVAVSLKSLFVENVETMQYFCVELITTVSLTTASGQREIKKNDFRLENSFSDFSHECKLSKSNYLQYPDFDQSIAEHETLSTTLQVDT